jgi:hypothetical protein
MTCCAHPVERHAYNGCADCACGVRWSEHPDRDSDTTPSAHPARIAELEHLRAEVKRLTALPRRSPRTPPLGKAPHECPICGSLEGDRTQMCRACMRAYEREAHTDGSVMEAISWAARRARAIAGSAAKRSR